MATNECEWCGMEYPVGMWDYYVLKVFKDKHIICSDCGVKIDWGEGGE